MAYTRTEKRESPRVALTTKVLKPAPNLDVVWKEDVQSVLDRANESLKLSRPAPAPSPPAPGFIAPGEPIRAPLQEGRVVPPSNVSYRDGLVPDTDEALQARLEGLTQRVYQVEIETITEVSFPLEPAKIVYEFDRPVTHVREAHGTLYSTYSDKGQVEFAEGMQVTRLIQIVRADELPEIETDAVKPLEVTVKAGQAVWTEGDENQTDE